jgi:hypothetical protein
MDLQQLSGTNDETAKKPTFNPGKFPNIFLRQDFYLRWEGEG